MTKEEILAMEAGIKLDELVAEGVMKYEKPNFFPPNALDLCLAGDAFHIPGWTCVCIYEEKDTPKWVPDLYSTNISAAWQVVEKMKGTEIWDDFCFSLAELCHMTQYDEGCFGYYVDDLLSNMNSEAICKAALLAKYSLQNT